MSFPRSTPGLVLRRDLASPLRPPRARIPITVRPATDADGPAILRLVSELSAKGRGGPELFLRLGIGTCYLAVTDWDELCYLQWLIGPQHRRLLEAHSRLPAPSRGEALLENAVTPAAFRRSGVMSAAMAQIAGRAGELEARWVLIVVSALSLASINGYVRAGFVPYMVTMGRWSTPTRRVGFAST